jgi:hypothetical protein
VLLGGVTLVLPDKAKSKLTVASLTLDASYPEGPGQPGIFGDLAPNLAKIIERIEDTSDASLSIRAIGLL